VNKFGAQYVRLVKENLKIASNQPDEHADKRTQQKQLPLGRIRANSDPVEHFRLLQTS
jgi:hypothetical protein